MNDCQDVEIREVLPELVHGTLPEVARTHVQNHLEMCDECSAELAIIHAVLGSAAVVSVDVSRVVAAIPPYRSRTSRMRRVYLELAAACVIGAVGISAIAVHNSSSASRAAHATASTTSSPGLALVNTSDLSDNGLAQLTQDLDKLQAMPTAEPEAVTPAALESATEPGTVGDSA